ncbi:hypothetical protein [uncultured Thiothrix sp.]|jgi:uncharacterized protein YjiS (DUF1127 family)|uniref:hypothetical protein n=1 Tax=uncultured Thiothrix sp. TaxID=223185 RepID=UPI00262BE92E|nr:hypothetical protein [uncultured Thiothrix sp.]HMT94398.1 hypothetical protein [Thiolinea sp.]
MKPYSALMSVPFGEWPRFRFKKLAERFKYWQILQVLRVQVAKERTELANLPDYILKDIGVIAGDAWLESQRSIDDLPLYRVKQALRHA